MNRAKYKFDKSIHSSLSHAKTMNNVNSTQIMKVIRIDELVLLLLFIVTPACNGGTFSNTRALPDSTTRATAALDGLFHYYWAHDSKDKSVQFFFLCGQIGGWGSDYVWNKCSCNNKISCMDCYRWWDAIALESIASYGIYTNSKRNYTVADMIYNHSPYNGNWDAIKSCTYIDDFLWYGMAYLRVYEWLKVSALHANNSLMNVCI